MSLNEGEDSYTNIELEDNYTNIDGEDNYSSIEPNLAVDEYDSNVSQSIVDTQDASSNVLQSFVGHSFEKPNGIIVSQDGNIRGR